MTHPYRRRLAIALGLTATLASPASAQLIPSIGGTVDRTLGGVAEQLSTVDRTLDDARSLARVPLQRASDLVRRYPDRIALDGDGNAVRAREVTVIDADAATIRAAEAQGFRLIEQVDLAELGLGYARFETSGDEPIGRTLSRMRKVAGKREVSADPLHFPGGRMTSAVGASVTPTVQASGRIGIIDGGVGPATRGLEQQRAFATGGPSPNDHATAIASLLTGGGGVRASAGGAALFVADVYGRDPAGGNATAITQALAWMTRLRVPVVVVSLVGPANPLLARVVAAARDRGTMVVAAVGNDGPAAPPAYPASYPQAIAVTGVDAKGRPLIEAGRAKHLDYAAPAADMIALDATGAARKVRGTSFAAPFVAARLSANLATGADAAIKAVDVEAKRGGRATGRGIVCGDCRTAPR